MNLDCIYDNSPLGFEKPISSILKKIESHDPLEEINLGTKENQNPIYVSKLLYVGLQEKIISLLHEFKDCFTWEYEAMPGLNRELVEHGLPICECKKKNQ